ncbi:NADH:ubiquinone oxidoreductase subunit NDUFA12 [Sphingomonas sp. C3-2]|uniref:NADH:ubiquinone oxidoreductase subunit NDUFA12 n=1 Tax=Sphingomonas sp. C3-2 TaxID=3062169 RepID=UPI00294B114E|nr:NADH:ubiquinone oxidoreductase subunit NDUFA12 [Sphingomonas sp. C3-2]WOK37378.1 NADH:ubiquinone oxidoreductase subunit NDUFA12 [Sphingomonas sp. C3-2]
MGIFKNIFTWWEGATFGTALNTMRNGRKVGEDHLGNVYYEGRAQDGRRGRRWVIYKGLNDSSRVPPEWHSWLHGTISGTPDEVMPPARAWQVEPMPNLTGTPQAYRPAGALEKGGQRAKATGDYEAWTPGA